jgi:hypothetical protein
LVFVWRWEVDGGQEAEAMNWISLYEDAKVKSSSCMSFVDLDMGRRVKLKVDAQKNLLRNAITNFLPRLKKLKHHQSRQNIPIWTHF